MNGSNAANVGNFLSATGSFATPVAGCSTCGVDYMRAGGQMYLNSGNVPNYVSNLNFITETGGLQVSLLYANSPENTLTSFVIFNTANVADVLLLEPAGINLNNAIGATYVFGTQFAGSTNLGLYDLSNGSPFASWGIYVTTCTEAASSQAACQADGDLVTYYLGANGQQFALFQSGTNASQTTRALKRRHSPQINPATITTSSSASILPSRSLVLVALEVVVVAGPARLFPSRQLFQ